MPLPKNLPIQEPTNTEGAAPLKEAVQVLAHRYRVERKLGSGAFGTAWLVTDLKSHNERKVLKKISVAELQPDETVGAVREARLLAKLHHPSIVKFHDSFLEKDYFCIVTELCEGGDLDQKIRQWRESGRSFEESLIVDWFIQLTAAIMYIHERRILHRDLKTRNIFLKNNLIKLGDFGISRILMGTTDLASTFTGTPYYMSPEVVQETGYNSKSDIWSLGAVLYELCTLERAFSGPNMMAVMYNIVTGDQPELPADFNPSLRILLSMMLDKDPHKRPSAISILQEPFLQERMQTLHGNLEMQLAPPTAISSPVEEAEAIAKALNPVKKKSLQGSLQGSSDSSSLTPRQRMAQRKQQKADREAEERRKMAAENLSERRKRADEQKKKKQARVVPPWVVEHPDVFSDPNFSITQMDTTSSEASSMELSAPLPEPPPQPYQQQQQKQKQQHVKAGDGGKGGKGGKGGGITEGVSAQKSSAPISDAAYIPDDPQLAETHYSQFNDFEDDSNSEDDYEALLECIGDALDLPNQPIPISPPVSPHDELSPFSPQAREQKIHLLRTQCIQIFGEQLFQEIYTYLSKARSDFHSTNKDEAEMVSGLKELTSNTRDCFLIDQLVFLEQNSKLTAN